MSLTDEKVSDYTLRLRIVVTLLPSFIHLSTLTTNFRFEPSHSPKIFVFLRIIVLLLLFTDGTNRTTRSASLHRLQRFAFLWTHTCIEFPLNVAYSCGLLELFLLWFQSKSLCLKVFISVIYVCAIVIPSAEIGIVFRCRNLFHCLCFGLRFS